MSSRKRGHSFPLLFFPQFIAQGQRRQKVPHKHLQNESVFHGELTSERDTEPHSRREDTAGWSEKPVKCKCHGWVEQARLDSEMWLRARDPGTPSPTPGTGGAQEISVELGGCQAYILLMLALVSINQHFASKSQTRCDP